MALIGRTHDHVKRTGVETNGIIECKSLFKKEHRTGDVDGSTTNSISLDVAAAAVDAFATCRSTTEAYFPKTRWVAAAVSAAIPFPVRM
jgi:hypothetical protein